VKESCGRARKKKGHIHKYYPEPLPKQKKMGNRKIVKRLEIKFCQNQRKSPKRELGKVN